LGNNYDLENMDLKLNVLYFIVFFEIKQTFIIIKNKEGARICQ
jgi:hypothetical protein